MLTQNYIEPASPSLLDAPWLRVLIEGEAYSPHMVRIRKRWFNADEIRKLDLRGHGHSHCIYHLIYYLEGTNSILVGDQTIEIAAGQMLLIDPDVYHNIIPREPKDCSFLTLMFTYQNNDTLLSIPFAQLLGHLAGYPLKLKSVTDDSNGNLRALFNMLEKDVMGWDELNLKRISYSLAGLFNELIGSSLRSEESRSIPDDILEVQRYMLMHFDQSITIDLLTEISRLSRSQLIGKFKQNCGMSPINFLIQTRIEKSKIYLLHSTKRIKEIAWLCGFQSEYYFCKTFKKRTGHTPGEFRNHGEGNANDSGLVL